MQSGCRRVKSLSQVSKQPNDLWIPAFAGMTEGLRIPIRNSIES